MLFDVLTGKMLLRQMLQQAKHEGLTIKVRHAKVLFCGPAAVGKTSFSRLLRNKEHIEHYESTLLGHTDQVMIGSKVHVKGERWLSLDHELENKHITHRLIQNFRKKKIASRDRSNTGSSTKCDVSASDSPHPVGHVQSDNIQNVSKPVDTNNINTPISMPNEDISDTQSVAQTPIRKSPSLPDADVKSSDKNIHASRKIGTEQKMSYYVNAPDEELDSIPETWEMLTLLDTGGQPEFINLLPAINSSTAITCVVFNMSGGKECLEKPVTYVYKHKGSNYKEDHSKYSTINLLKCLLFSIKFSAMNQTYNANIDNKAKGGENPASYVCIIGTHADSLRKECDKDYDKELSEINTKFKDLIDEIKEHKGKDVEDNMIFWYDRDSSTPDDISYVFPVDNRISRVSPKDDFESKIAKVAEQIREYSNEVLKEKAENEIPITWFILELELRNSDKVCISLNEIKDICDRIMLPYENMDTEKIKEILKFYHMYGMLLYFDKVKGMDNFVITNPQWLFNNLAEILMRKQHHWTHRADLVTDMQKGICHMKLLETLNLNLQGVGLESFVALLEHLKVIVPIKNKNAYFIPSILPHCDEEHIFTEKEYGEVAAYTNDKQSICKTVEPLLIQFNFGTIPRGLLGFLAVQLLQDESNNFELFHTNEFHQKADLICFYVEPWWYIYIHDRILYLEIEVRVMGKHHSYHYEAQKLITEALETLCKDFKWNFSDCHYGFYFPKHKEGSHSERLALLDTNPPYIEEIPKSASCGREQRSLELGRCHEIWFKVC